MQRKSKVLLSSFEQRRAIASTVRMELLEHLHAGPATVATLAERMGRTPNSLYHHVRLLVDAGILHQVDSLRSGARTQAVYDVTAEVFEIAEGADADGGRTELKAARVILRKAEREFDDALQADPNLMHRRDVFVGRMRARLSAARRKEVMRHLGAIQKIYTDEIARDTHLRARPRACSFTGAFLPTRP